MPADLRDAAEARRQELVEAVAEADDATMALFVEESPVPGDELAAAVRRATIAGAFFPVFLGSAFRNVGVQALLDGVAAFLPSPTEVRRRGRRCEDLPRRPTFRGH